MMFYERFFELLWPPRKKCKIIPFKFLYRFSLLTMNFLKKRLAFRYVTSFIKQSKFFNHYFEERRKKCLIENENKNEWDCELNTDFITEASLLKRSLDYFYVLLVPLIQQIKQKEAQYKNVVFVLFGAGVYIVNFDQPFFHFFPRKYSFFPHDYIILHNIYPWFDV